MHTSILNDKTLENLIAAGNRMAVDGDILERTIWSIKAESIAQIADATKAFEEAREKNSTTPEIIEALHLATARYLELTKLWNQAVALRNRAVHFGNLPRNGVPAHDALVKVFEGRKKR